MSYWLVEGHFEHKHLKKGKCKVDWTLRFFNDPELCACLVWVSLLSHPPCASRSYFSRNLSYTHFWSPLYTLVLDPFSLNLTNLRGF